jgi:hypothetical protein
MVSNKMQQDMPNTTMVGIGDNRKPAAFTKPLKPVIVTNLPIYINNPGYIKIRRLFYMFCRPF